MSLCWCFLPFSILLLHLKRTYVKRYKSRGLKCCPKIENETFRFIFKRVKDVKDPISHKGRGAINLSGFILSVISRALKTNVMDFNLNCWL